MELNVKERILLLNALPQTGSLTEMRASKALSKSLIISETEKEEFELVEEGGTIKWNAKGEENTYFDLSDAEINVIKDIVMKWDTERLITIHNIELAEKITNL